MLLLPRKRKYRKEFKGKISGLEHRANSPRFGEFALKAQEIGRLHNFHLEAARRIITRDMKRMGRLWVRIFPNVPITTKPNEIRMGKGKGGVDSWACRVKPGQILYEIAGIREDFARRTLYRAATKLPISTLFVSRNEMVVK